MFIIGIYAWTNGNFKKLTTAYDPDGKGCGVDYPNYPYIYFASPHTDSLWATVCLSSCPKATDATLSCQPNSVVTACTPVNNADNTKAVQMYDTYAVGGTVCMPASDKIKAEISTALGGNADMLSSLSNSWTLVLISIPIAILLSIIFMLVIRFTAGCFVYILIFFAIGALVAIGVYLIMSPSTGASSGYLSLLQNRPVCIIIAVLCFILAGIILVMLICFRKRISLASSIIKVSAKFVDNNLGVLLLPIILFVVMILFLTLWILEALGYYSLGTPITAPHQYPYQHFAIPWSIYALGLVHVFYLFWVMMFLVETSGFIIGGAACSWYYKTDNPYSESSARYRRFHIGSVCLGSFFLALIGFIKFLYELLTPESDDNTGCLGSWKKFCSCLCCLCVTYLFSCFNSGAYTFIHLSGKSYCPSAFEVIAAKIK